MFPTTDNRLPEQLQTETSRAAEPTRSITPGRFLKFTTAVATLYFGWLILTPYPHYLPADLSRGFLRDKGDFFYSSAYFVGFYAHIVAAPLALLCGTIQISRTLRIWYPTVHRAIGKAYVLLVLCLAAPGGAIMATRAFGGASSILCFELISVLSWVFTWRAWRAAKAFQYPEHGRWMIRSYLMICSAILLRLIHYLMQSLNLEPVLTYQLAAWLSWLPALILSFLVSHLRWSSAAKRIANSS